jgi:LysM domain
MLRPMASVQGRGPVMPIDRGDGGHAESRSRDAATQVGPLRPDVVVRGICPYLGTGEGWRLAVADRSHRCLAVSPPTQLALEKQTRLCLDERHHECATYRAALSAIAADEPVGGRAERTTSRRRRRWSVPRTQATVLDVGRGSVDVAAVARQRATTQVALVLLALIAFGALVLARASSSGPAVGGPSPTPTLAVVADGGPSPTVPPTPSPSTVLATPRPTPVPGATPAPRRYTVRSGDTLVRIASRFHTTVKAIQAANGISNTSRLAIGQVLRIP